MEACEAINLGIYVVASVTSFVAGLIVAGMFITKNPHLFWKDKPND